jgi:IS30 family transposase
MQRATPRKYTGQDKAEFFRPLGVNPNVSAVARELGFTRVTCYAWAYKAGIRTSEARKVNPRREEFLRLRAAGLTRAEARSRVGADSRSATDWDKGITSSTAAGSIPMDVSYAIHPRRARHCPA